MAVSALELRPRNAVALFDAALRLCVTSSGVWALTLPAGALLVGALFQLVDAITRNHSLLEPVAFFTGAWLFRAISQGAACHYVEHQVLGTTPPSVRGSFLAALKRAPSLFIATTWMAVVNSLIWVFTLGIGFFFLGAHAAGYAVVMRGQGSALGLYGNCSKLLGPTRSIAPWVRLCGLSQVLLGVNLHIATLAVLYLANSLFGFDVTFVDRFASLDNPTWVATVVALTFALFDAVRAATGTLLLVDGRVRQEGLDLLAQVEQLPRRVRHRSAPLVATALVLLLSSSAFAEPSALVARAQKVTSECGLRIDLTALRRVADEDQSATARLLSRVERRAFEEEDCDAAEADLREGLRLLGEALVTGEPIDAQARAKDILQRPEFETVTEKEKTAEPEKADEPGWLARLIKALLEWLESLSKKQKDREDIDVEPSSGGDMAAANTVMIVALLVVAGVLIFILVRSFKSKNDDQTNLDESGGLSLQGLDADPMSALSRPSETWAGLADELAARGEFREAIRHLYLALLSRLHRDGVIDYDPTLSNWEYLFAFKGSGAFKTAFKELTRRFDFAWYGNVDVDSLAWAVFRRTAEPMLVPPTGEAARA